MPRIPRGDAAEGIYHIINRGNMRMQIFDDPEDYEYFLELIRNKRVRLLSRDRGQVFNLHFYSKN